MGISEQSTLLCQQKLLTSRQIFRYAVPARTVTKKALCVCNNLWVDIDPDGAAGGELKRGCVVFSLLAYL